MNESKFQTGFKLIDNLPEKHFTKIQGISDERDAGDGFWISLNKGFCGYGNKGRHSVHERTITETVYALRNSVGTCNCNRCLTKVKMSELTPEQKEIIAKEHTWVAKETPEYQEKSLRVQINKDGEVIGVIDYDVLSDVFSIPKK